LRSRAAEAVSESARKRERAAAAAAAFAPVAHLRTVRRAQTAMVERLANGAARLDETLRVAAAAAARLETPPAERADSLAEGLRVIAARESDLRRAAAEADPRALGAERLPG